MFVLPCLAVLVPGGALATFLLAAAAAMSVLVPGAAFGQQQQQVSWWDWKSGKGWDWKSGKGWEKNIFSRNSEGTLGTFSVRFCGMFVLPCLAVLVPGGALATLLLAAAAGELMGDWKSGKGWVNKYKAYNTYKTYGTYNTYNTLHYITVHYITLQYNTLQYIILHYNTIQYLHSSLVWSCFQTIMWDFFVT